MDKVKVRYEYRKLIQATTGQDGNYTFRDFLRVDKDGNSVVIREYDYNTHSGGLAYSEDVSEEYGG
jgi:hypothetical protein